MRRERDDDDDVVDSDVESAVEDGSAFADPWPASPFLLRAPAGPLPPSLSRVRAPGHRASTITLPAPSSSATPAPPPEAPQAGAHLDVLALRRDAHPTRAGFLFSNSLRWEHRVVSDELNEGRQGHIPLPSQNQYIPALLNIPGAYNGALNGQEVIQDRRYTFPDPQQWPVLPHGMYAQHPQLAPTPPGPRPWHTNALQRARPDPTNVIEHLQLPPPPPLALPTTTAHLVHGGQPSPLVGKRPLDDDTAANSAPTGNAPRPVKAAKTALDVDATPKMVRRVSPGSNSTPAANPRKEKAHRDDEEDEDATEAESADGGPRWTDDETSALLHGILDADAMKVWGLWKTNHVWAFNELEKTVFKGTKRTSKSIQGRFERLFKTYKKILQYNSFTGGAGDGDDDDGSDDYILRRIAKAREHGKQVDNLTPRIVKEFTKKGWFNLFNKRMAGNPAAAREKVWASNMLSSDNEIEEPSENSDNGDDADPPAELARDVIEIEDGEASAATPPLRDTPAPAARPAAAPPAATTEKRATSTATPTLRRAVSTTADTPPTSRASSKSGRTKTALTEAANMGVPEPAHTPSKRTSKALSVTAGASEFFENSSAFMKIIGSTGERKLEVLERREARADRQEERDALLAKVDRARQIVADTEMPDDVRDAARKFLLKQFQF
ncbi:hypothetical protein FA95DRAFT_1612960 [Auriscalpium vulgare]|uniref:Uncharacterized protein n=1 Tax=Auriscalpium vulgare TaxID=40419 RepID=A0ACB8R5X3_9AGAM|nr:hypothetical protein FA95DRAFT_1612960 [Auriscalpium vulgare]